MEGQESCPSSPKVTRGLWQNQEMPQPGPQGPQPHLHPQAFPEWKYGVGMETWWEVVPVSTPIPGSQGPVIARAV